MRNEIIDVESSTNRLDKKCQDLVFSGYNYAIYLQKEVHQLKEEINRITKEYKYSTWNFDKEIKRLEDKEDELRSRLN